MYKKSKPLPGKDYKRFYQLFFSNMPFSLIIEKDKISIWCITQIGF